MADADTYIPRTDYSKTVLVNGSTTSTAADISGMTLVGVITPASLVSTSLTFAAATTATGTYVAVKDTLNSAITVTCDSSAAYYALDPADFAGVRHLKIEMGSSETNKTLTLVLRPL